MVSDDVFSILVDKKSWSVALLQLKKFHINHEDAHSESLQINRTKR